MGFLNRPGIEGHEKSSEDSLRVGSICSTYKPCLNILAPGHILDRVRMESPSWHPRKALELRKLTFGSLLWEDHIHNTLHYTCLSSVSGARKDFSSPIPLLNNFHFSVQPLKTKRRS